MGATMAIWVNVEKLFVFFFQTLSERGVRMKNTRAVEQEFKARVLGQCESVNYGTFSF